VLFHVKKRVSFLDLYAGILGFPKLAGEKVDDGHLHSCCDVSVDVQRRSDITMTQAFLDDLDIDPRL